MSDLRNEYWKYCIDHNISSSIEAEMLMDYIESNYSLTKIKDDK